MGAATLLGFEIAPPAYGRRRFTINYQAANYNDVLVTCALPESIITACDQGSIVVTHISICHSGTIGVEFTYVVMIVNKSVGCYLPNYTTTKAIDTHAYDNIDICVNPATIPTTFANTWFGLYPTGYAAGDDLNSICIRGYIELPDAITPVSLEGYKWPLIRR